MFLLRFVILIFLFCAFFVQNAFCAAEYRVNGLLIDNSDKFVLINGQGSYKTTQTSTYVPIPSANTNTSTHLINNLTTFTLTNPYRFVVDIPNAKLNGASRTYKIKNSNTIKEIVLSQFSASPDVVRAVFSVNSSSDLSKFKVFSNGSDIIVKYINGAIITNSHQYKFYTPQGDMDSSVRAQNTSLSIVYNNNNETKENKANLQNKYYLGQINQNSDGLLLKGIGSISLIRPQYNADNTKAVLYLDSASLSKKYENKTFNIPSSRNLLNDSKTTLTLSTFNSKRVKLELNGSSLRDYRFILSSDGQSLYISHRTYVLNHNIASSATSPVGYNFTKTQNGYWLFDLSFLKSAVYDAFELDGNFYLDIYNLSDFNQQAFNSALKNTNIKVKALKISPDKTRFIVPLNELNFAYANVESNAKSIKLCFKEKPLSQIKQDSITIASNEQNLQVNYPQNVQQTTNPVQKINENEVIILSSKPTKLDNKVNEEDIIFIPKKDKEKEKKEPPRPSKRKSQISTMKKVVIDPGHGGLDSGAIGGGVHEKNQNLAVALLVEEKLKQKNIYTYMTRSSDKTLSLEDRTNYSNELEPDIFVSIHTNSTLQADSYGLEIHYFKDDSYDLAQVMHDNFISEKNLKKWDTKDRGVIKSRFYVINHTEAPSVLIEMGFLSNAEERAKLITKKRQEEIADSIVEGILEYLGVK